jgi:hypothetical protein
METAKKERELLGIASDAYEKQNVIDQHHGIAKQSVSKITQIIPGGRSTAGTSQENDSGWWKNLRGMKKW